MLTLESQLEQQAAVPKTQKHLLPISPVTSAGKLLSPVGWTLGLKKREFNKYLLFKSHLQPVNFLTF